MRSLGVLVLMAACTDAAEVPSTVAHIDTSVECATPGCTVYGAAYFDDCGPIGSTTITPTTRELEVTTSYDAKDILGYAQLQYTNAQSGETAITDLLLTQGDETFAVYAAYGDMPLYQLNAVGEVSDIDTSVLASANGNTLEFQYTVGDVTAHEQHAIDAAKPLRLETNDPGIADACCSVGDWRQGSFMILVILFGLPRRRP